MRDAIELNVTHVKCDAEGCDYITHDVSNDTLADYRNKPCPKCGANLLTDEDYYAFQGHLEVVSLLSELFPKGSYDEERVILATGETDGSGSVKVSLLNNQEA